MVETIFYILNIVWAQELNHNQDCRHISRIRDSHTVQAQTDMNLRTSSA